VERREWVPLDELLGEVEAALGAGAAPDYVTVSGSGEPTLYSRLGELVAGVKRITRVPVAVLTNGSLLGDPGVRAGLAAADLVVPSLDAGDAETFRRVNRPHQSIDFDRMVEGLVEFRRGHPGRLWLEVFLLAGINQVGRIAGIAGRVDPERVQLNTVARPPAESSALAVTGEELERLAAAFGGRAEVIAGYRGAHAGPGVAARREDVLDLLRRRPCTVAEVAAGLALHRNEAAKYVGELLSAGRLAAEESAGEVYYRVAGGGG
jgi:wyosine [tRNA(Phe)-imidazoG37] synthetase (radical SAM superfamily)